MKVSRYLKAFPSPGRRGRMLLYSTRLASLAEIEEDLWRAAVRGKAPAADRGALVRLGMLVADPEAEKAEMLSFCDNLNRGNPLLSATVVLNLDCNLDCAYCYQGEGRGKHYMSPATADLLVDFLDRRLGDGKTRLEVDFYGGEPLLSPDLLFFLAGKLGEVSRSRGAGFGFRLVTNGTLLTPSMASLLLPLGLVGAKVTLDGPRETHDLSRPFKGGAGSFDAILRNLKEVCSLTKVQVGGNYTRENHRLFPRLLDVLAAEGITPDRLAAVKFDPVVDAALFRSAAGFGGCRSFSEPWLVEAGLLLREEILRRGWRTSRLRPSPCAFDVVDDFTVNWDGKLYKCPGFIGREGLEAGDLRVGLKERAGVGAWRDGECPDCAYLPLCFGGCRFLKLIREGSIDGVDCRKEYLDAVLLPTLLQDMRYVLEKRDRKIRPDPASGRGLARRRAPR